MVIMDDIKEGAKMSGDTEENSEAKTTFYNATGKEIRIYNADDLDTSGPVSYVAEGQEPLLVIPPDGRVLKAEECYKKARYIGDRYGRYKIMVDDYLDQFHIFKIEDHEILYYKDVSLVPFHFVYDKFHEWVIVGDSYFEAAQRRNDDPIVRTSRKVIRPVLPINYHPTFLDGGGQAGYLGFEFLETRVS